MSPTKFDQVLEKTANNKSLDTEILRSIGYFIFSELKKEMNLFKRISIKLEGFGIWFYRRNKLKELKRRITNTLNKTKEEPYYSLRNMTEDEVRELERLVDARMVDYENYVKEKKAVKSTRKIINE